MNTNSSINKDRQMQTQVYDNGENVLYSFLTLKVSLPPMLHNGSIYNPKMGNRGFNKRIFHDIEGQGSRYLLLDWKNSNYFFLAQNPMYMYCNGARCVYTSNITMTQVYLQKYILKG